MGAEAIQQELQHHWRMDEQAAETLSERISASNQEDQIFSLVESLDSEAVKWRDQHRDNIGNLFDGSNRQVSKTADGLIIFGPCSLDEYSDYSELFDYIDELQEAYPETIFALRGNSAKPRTSGGWTGLWYSLDTTERSRIWDVYSQAMKRKIPVIAEVTQNTQIAALAPWMSGMWLGARDIPSTTLRSMASVIHLPTGVKNGIDGDPETVRNTIKAIRSNTAKNDGSGVDLGAIASTPHSPGIATGILPVGEGNEQTAIIARGYKLPEDLSSEERRTAALRSLSDMCILGAELGSSVLIDGTHGVPPMFDIEQKDAGRIVPVLHEINEAVHQGEVDSSHLLSGIVAEIGTSIGRTDPNYVLTKQSKAVLSALVGETIDMMHHAKKS